MKICPGYVCYNDVPAFFCIYGTWHHHSLQWHCWKVSSFWVYFHFGLPSAHLLAFTVPSLFSLMNIRYLNAFCLFFSSFFFGTVAFLSCNCHSSFIVASYPLSLNFFILSLGSLLIHVSLAWNTPHQLIVDLFELGQSFCEFSQALVVDCSYVSLHCHLFVWNHHFLVVINCLYLLHTFPWLLPHHACGCFLLGWVTSQPIHFHVLFWYHHHHGFLLCLSDLL